MATRLSLKKRIFFICIVIFLTALGLESMTRLFRSIMQTESVVPAHIGQIDSMLGWSLKPYSSGISNRTGAKIEYRINSKGLRDNETNYHKPKGIFRIVLLGDSRTFGYGVPVEKHFSKLLEGYFNAVEVINLGVSGFGVDQELLYLRSEGFKYAPDLVIAYVAHYGDHRHMHGERFGKKKPRFLLVEGELVLTNSPIAPYRFLQKLHFGMTKHINSYAILSKSLTRIMHQRSSAKQQEQLDKSNLENEEFRRKLYALGEKLVYTMHEESLTYGATFVLVTHIPKLYKATLEKGLFALNVKMALSNKQFKLPDNLKHINECGNGVLAWEIVQFLEQNQLVPPNHLK